MECTILALLLIGSCIVSVTPLTTTQVHNAVEYIKKNFKLSDVSKQYAYAVVFTKKEYERLSSEKLEKKLKFLKYEDAGEIKNCLNNDDSIYEGKQMVFATFQSKKDKKSKTDHNVHAEYRLLFGPNGSGVSPVYTLLRRNPEAAFAIFFTRNSPCLSVCTNCMHKQCIIEKLSDFNKINEKSFVYQEIYAKDNEACEKNKILEGLTKVNEKMPVYRCFSRKCYACFKDQTNTNHCLYSDRI